jgi:hypothetical protein
VREKGAAHSSRGDVEEVAAAVAARGCHGTSRTRPRQLEGREATGVSSRGWSVGWHRRSAGEQRQRAETLAAEGVQCVEQRRRPGQENRSDGGEDQEAVVRLRPAAAAGAIRVNRNQRSVPGATPWAAEARGGEEVVGQV